MKVLTNATLSGLFLLKQTMTCEHCNSSSANSRRVKNESFDPLHIPLSGTCTYKRRFHSTDSHVTDFESVRWKLNANLTALSNESFVTSSHFTETVSATGGSLNFPTPLPSAFNSNTLAAWGTSGAPQRPSIDRY
uniref:U17-Nephitoxin-Nsp1b_1 n=1 Tax=Nephila sp. SGP-2016 TaxID=1905176 RepID=A0A4V2H976_9ARAC